MDKNRHVIWNNDVAAIFNELEEIEEYEDMPESSRWDLAYRYVEENLEAELIALDVELENEIVLTGNLVRWNGSFNAYKETDTRNIGKAIEKALSAFSGDNTFEIYVEDGSMYISQLGHDNPCNPSIFEFRVLKDDVDLDEEDSPIDFTKVSDPIGAKVSEVYNWEQEVA